MGMDRKERGKVGKGCKGRGKRWREERGGQGRKGNKEIVPLQVEMLCTPLTDI